MCTVYFEPLVDGVKNHVFSKIILDIYEDKSFIDICMLFLCSKLYIILLITFFLIQCRMVCALVCEYCCALVDERGGCLKL